MIKFNFSMQSREVFLTGVLVVVLRVEAGEGLLVEVRALATILEKTFMLR